MKHISLSSLSACCSLLAATLLTSTAYGQVSDTSGSKSSDNSFSLDLNPEYATGQYGGSSKIDDYILNTTLRYRTQDWSFKLLLPYIRTTSDRTVLRIDSGQIVCDNRGGNRGPGSSSGTGTNSSTGGNSGSGNSGSGSSNSGSGNNGSGNSGSGNSGSGNSGSGNSGSSNSGSGNSGSGNSGSGNSSNGSNTISSSGSNGSQSVDSNCPTATSSGRNEVNAGMGDISLSASYHLLKSSSGLSVDVKGKVKLATAKDDSGLGSRSTDFTLTTSVAQSLGTWEPFVDVSYKVRGSRDGVKPRNQTGFVLGLRKDITSASNIELSYEHKSASSSDSDPARSVGVTVGTKLSRGWDLEGYYFKGLTDAVADRVAGVTVSYRF